MRLPRRPHICFRFVEKPAGEILLQTWKGKGATLDMQRIIGSVSQFAQGTFWPDGHIAGPESSGVEPDVPQAKGLFRS